MTTYGSDRSRQWLHSYAIFTAVACLALLSVGGLVTSRGAGMSVPDWPTSYGYNMFALPFSHWMGGALYEHSHRLVATLVGVLTVGLTRWLGGVSARRPLLMVGAGELAAGLVFVALVPELKGTGHFLLGIAGVVLLAAAVPVGNVPAPRPLPFLGWVAFVMVQLIGLLGGLRVVLFKNELGFFHVLLAQLFFLLIVGIALLTSRTWTAMLTQAASVLPRWPSALAKPALLITLLVLLQLIIGATMRHQHAGLAIPDFSLAYGRVWPATDPASIERYNQQRIEVTAVRPITAFQVHLQMAHRVTAVLLTLAVCAWAIGAWRGSPRSLAARLGTAWAFLVLAQVALGAWTVWSDKAADVATLHMIAGALTFALGGIITLFSFPEIVRGRTAGHSDPLPVFGAGSPNPARSTP